MYLSLDNAYHGDTLGAAAVGGVELFHDIFKPILLPSLKTPSPYCYRCPIGKTPADCSIDCADELEQALRRANGRVCAVILEPGVQAAAGMLTLPEGFLSRAADACRRHGALLILDEVATGFGRTGTHVRVRARRCGAGSDVRGERADGRLSSCCSDAGDRSRLRRVSRPLR